MKNEWQLRREIIEIGKKAYDKDFVTATDGNISARVMGDRFLITPSGSCLGELKPEQLVYVDINGNILTGRGKPTTELPMHLTAYKERPDIDAVIHAHPPVTTGLTVAGQSLAHCVIPEVVLIFGTIPTSEYATPTTPEGADVIKNLIRDYDAIILDRHGTLTVGKSIQDAYRKLEKVEYCAKVTVTAHQLGRIRTLSVDELNKLDQLRKQSGNKNQLSLCEICGICRS
jgi:L-fuculose-phosphate aldolase